MSPHIPFNLPHLTGRELGNVSEASAAGRLAGDGPFTKRCHEWIEEHTGCERALLTHSCTAALEMAALLLDIEAGDEIIMPSYTFVSTANAFVLRGGVPVFVDIRYDTLNLDERLVEEAITPRTRAIVPVHYAGVGCAMDELLDIARRHDLAVVEDAAQGVMSAYKGRPLGSIGDLGTYSFHETKNVISGEGGAILINNPKWADRAEIIRDKGTDRSRFFRGQIDKYTWQDVGSSFLPGEIIAAFLSAQLDDAASITAARIERWNRYHALLENEAKRGVLRQPIIPSECDHNAHMYYVILDEGIDRHQVLEEFARRDITSVFHYVPLHTSPAGTRFGRAVGELPVTMEQSRRLVRLPLWVGLSDAQQDSVVDVLQSL